MGLDQTLSYFIRTKGNENLFERNEIYFRKVNCLQGYFEKEYDIQNCQEIRISFEDIKKINEITKYILNNKNDLEYIEENFPPTQGFFYGSDEIDDDYYFDVKEVYEATKEIISLEFEEIHLYYWCWY